MRAFMSAILALSFAGTGLAFAQNADNTGGGMNSNSRSMSGANLDVDNGINANGTPKQQSPGASMTNGPNTPGISGTLNGDGNVTQGGAASPFTPNSAPGATLSQDPTPPGM